ncbi:MULTISPECIES: ABC transporter ATP-binding protein [unclassified Xanthobacter]|uniref:ABC transporter ATP-binding protein n=1 Tax=unclassified Xanthobacter TaxID=2623496 RepID=UPI001EDF9B83|nr:MULTISPECIES: ABC transporter ATP-binding protein [unclassified Xanthobacter]
MSPCDDQGGLRARNLSAGYGRSLILRELDLAVPPGAFTALVGPNGSGKSTLLHALAGLLAPREGAVLLDGEAISRLPVKALAKRVSLLAQGPIAPEGLTVFDLVQQGRYPHRALFERWSARDVAACDEALRLTDMAVLRDRPLADLSGGQRQRAWIAMTLAQEAEIVLLDEPTSFLDLAHQIEVMELVVELVRGRGKTFVAVLHDLNQAARYVDHMVLLKAGRIMAAGAPAQVLTAEAIATVFGVAATVVPDPVTGTPMCVPLCASLLPVGPMAAGGGGVA